VDLVRIWPSKQERPESLERLGLLRDLRHTYNLRDGRGTDYRRTARCILGRANILVLGGGGAKGFAHVGALQALQEQERLEIDMVVGISIGSLIGSLYALEHSIGEIRRILMETFVKTSPYSLTLPIHSLFRYNHHIRAAEKIYRDLEVADTWIPFRPGSVDLTSNQLVFSHRHSLMRTVIASMSIPGLMPPTPLPTGGLHVDGAVLNNVPIMEARRWTTGKVIAISLDHGEGQRAVLTIGKQHFWLWRLLRRLGIVRDDLPSITITILQSMLCSAREKSDKEELFADLMLKPNLADVGILEWSAHQKVEREGYRAMRDELGRTS
jgi:NTE family protein